MQRSDKRKSWTLWLLVSVPVIMVAMFVVPYTLLREVDAWYGSLLFWTVGTAAVIAINVAVALSWENER
ncbi:hypothetical protein [Nesterenkonia haasae]|uniref:hypothetical protein n=1 Tax=Nesterenkonia haasae TaxID=2587813 RepID=UPI001391CFF2|nr:hypothetical protein [Nesterenkonia haasae]NDK31556.1 hypothetical protein [Nesterenkonia haasae]